MRKHLLSTCLAESLLKIVEAYCGLENERVIILATDA